MQPASRKSERGLDWFTFFVADMQTGFGPFLAIYLTTQKWNQADIGLVLAIGSIAGLISQLPGGWLVDTVRSKRKAAMLAVVGIGASALLIALAPSFLGIVAAKLLHVGAELRAGSRHRRHYARSRRPCRRRAALRPKRALCIHRQRPGGGRHGRVRLFHLAAGGILRHRSTGHSDPARSRANPGSRDRSGPRRWRHHPRPVPDHIAAGLGTLLRNRSLIITGCLRLFVPRGQRGDAAAGRSRDDRALGASGQPR